MKNLRTVLVSILLSVMVLYEYSSGGFHRLYVKTQLINNNTVIVMYGADWCGACKVIHPVLEKMELAGLIKLIYVDVDLGTQDVHGVLTPYIPQIAVWRKTPHGKMGLAYYGLFPRSYGEMMFIVFPDANELDVRLIQYSLGSLYLPREPNDI